MRHFIGLLVTGVTLLKSLRNPLAQEILVTVAGSAALLLLTGCASPVVDCPAGLSPMTTADLYFGRGQASGVEVSEADWQRFVDEEVTPRFPDGLSVSNVQGQWKGSAGIIRERAKHVTIVFLGKAPADKLEAVRAAYKARFHQESVLLLETPSCGSF